MTNPDYRHYIVVTDRSGSMGEKLLDPGTSTTKAAAAQQGIRSYLSEQAALPGKALLSFYQFDTTHDTVHDFAPLSDAAGYVLLPRGGTALLDAIGFALTQAGEKFAAMPENERPGKVYVLIATDGLENSSREYSKDQIKAMITMQQGAWNWQFSYIGAEQDAFMEAGAIGIPAASTMNYASTSGGTQSAYASASAGTLRHAKGQSANISYTDAERKAAADKDK